MANEWKPPEKIRARRRRGSNDVETVTAFEFSDSPLSGQVDYLLASPLLEAAPELLEAVKQQRGFAQARLDHTVESYQRGVLRDDIAALDAIIAKAEGTTDG